MPSYSEEFRRKVRDDWVLGKYPSLKALSVAYGVRIETIWRWKDREGWEGIKAEVQTKSHVRTIENLAQERARIDQIYLEVWAEIREAAQQMIGGVIEGKDTKGLAELSLAIQRAQQGHRIALGIEEKEEQPAAPDERLAELSEEELEKEIDRLRDEILAEAGDRPAASPAARKAAAAGGE